MASSLHDHATIKQNENVAKTIGHSMIFEVHIPIKNGNFGLAGSPSLGATGGPNGAEFGSQHKAVSLF